MSCRQFTDAISIAIRNDAPRTSKEQIGRAYETGSRFDPPTRGSGLGLGWRGTSATMTLNGLELLFHRAAMPLAETARRLPLGDAHVPVFSFRWILMSRAHG